MLRKNEQVENEAYKKAKKHANKIKGFYEHLLVFGLSSPIIIIVNVLTTSFPWAAIAVFSWSIAIFLHWYDVFAKETLLGKDWQERKITELMGQERGEKLKRTIPADYFVDADEDETQHIRRSG